MLKFIEDIQFGGSRVDAGEFEALCAHIAENGVPAEFGRSFAKWLEAAGEAFAERRFEEDEEEREAQEEPEEFAREIVEDFPFFYEKKAEAEAALAISGLEADPRVLYTQVAMEPYNGWHIRVVAKSFPMEELWDRVAVYQPDGKRVSAWPNSKKAIPPLAAPTVGKPDGAVSAPSPKGATGKVWEIADGMHAETPLMASDRARVIAACQAVGINPATAATQWSKWKKARGV